MGCCYETRGVIITVPNIEFGPRYPPSDKTLEPSGRDITHVAKINRCHRLFFDYR